MALYGTDYEVFCGSIKEGKGNGKKYPGPSAMDVCLLRELGTFHNVRSPCGSEPIPMRKLSTGEPCAGEPLARFGGRGESGRALL